MAIFRVREKEERAVARYELISAASDSDTTPTIKRLTHTTQPLPSYLN